jgi:tRNA(adenine34) deaminase
MKHEIFSNEYYMKLALQEAKAAYDKNEIPVGAIVVCNNHIIARTHNLTEQLNDVTAHAEMQAVTAAQNALGAKYLTDCTMYVTLEPCVMCAGALFWSRLGELVYGAPDPKRGYSTTGIKLLHAKTRIVKNMLTDECTSIMTNFFKQVRE